MPTSNRKEGMIYVGDSKVGSSNFPACVCIYENMNNYYFAEVNTGYHIGSIKCVSETFTDLSKAEEIYSKISNYYPLLKNHVIYNDYNQ